MRPLQAAQRPPSRSVASLRQRAVSRRKVLQRADHQAQARALLSNFRMNEFTGAVLVAQVRKLDRVASDIRAVARRVYEGIADLPGLKLRHRPDPAGELGVGVYLGFASKEKRDGFLAAMKSENVPCSPPSGSAVLPVQKYAEEKLTVHPAWPTFNSPRGKAIQYGAKSCPRTLDVLNRFGGVALDPKYTVSDTRDIVAAIRKVYPKVAG